MVDKAGFMAAVAANDTIAVTGYDGITWTATVVELNPSIDLDLTLQEPERPYVTFYFIDGTEQKLHIDGKGDF